MPVCIWINIWLIILHNNLFNFSWLSQFWWWNLLNMFRFNNQSESTEHIVSDNVLKIQVDDPLVMFLRIFLKMSRIKKTNYDRSLILSVTVWLSGDLLFIQDVPLVWSHACAYTYIM